MAKTHKDEIITFKADASLAQALAGVGNRSDFIRNAVLQALGNICPLCNGAGTLSASQKNHWEVFARHHRFETCDGCQEEYLVCDHEPSEAPMH
ncbi:MAG: CopG family transcriptional regulator [Spirochaetales bacterium]|nr:CopG family transcriptional regulator [Spirochaetales bacterium]